ncbi:MAG: phage holin family protein [Beutenbergiaceae bacterium]
MTDLPSRPGSEPSLGQLVGKMTETVSALVRDEIQLAQAQVAEKGKAMGGGVAMFVGAGVCGLFGLGWLLHTAYLALSLAVSPWIAALIVAVVVLLIAAAAALLGKRMIANAPSPQTKENIQRDLDAIKAGMSS